MSPTNIHNPLGLLSRAGNPGTFSDQATIQPSNKPVLVVSTSFSQDDVNQYSWCLRTRHIGSWIRGDAVSSASKGALTSADDRLDMPQVRIGPGLAQARNPSSSPSVPSNPSEQQTKFVLVIQGRSGANRVKVMVLHTLEQAAATMLHEALNGYSTEFSAAYTGPMPQQFDINTKLVCASGHAPPVKSSRGTWESVSLVCCLPPRQPFGSSTRGAEGTI